MNEQSGLLSLSFVFFRVHLTAFIEEGGNNSPCFSVFIKTLRQYRNTLHVQNKIQNKKLTNQPEKPNDNDRVIYQSFLLFL